MEVIIIGTLTVDAGAPFDVRLTAGRRPCASRAPLPEQTADVHDCVAAIGRFDDLRQSIGEAFLVPACPRCLGQASSRAFPAFPGSSRLRA